MRDGMRMWKSAGPTVAGAVALGQSVVQPWVDDYTNYTQSKQLSPQSSSAVVGWMDNMSLHYLGIPAIIAILLVVLLIAGIVFRYIMILRERVHVLELARGTAVSMPFLRELWRTNMASPSSSSGVDASSVPVSSRAAAPFMPVNDERTHLFEDHVQLLNRSAAESARHSGSAVSGGMSSQQLAQRLQFLHQEFTDRPHAGPTSNGYPSSTASSSSSSYSPIEHPSQSMQHKRSVQVTDPLRASLPSSKS